MSPQIATLLCILLIIFLFWIDRNNNEDVSKSIWIPFIWMSITGSRSVSHWFNLGTPILSGDPYLEGSPIDRAFYSILIIAAAYVLHKRQFNWTEFFNKNKFIWLYFVFGALSILWSDYPFITFKRLFKSSGTVMMALIILTEEQPYIAMGTILRRIAFLLLPLSALFIRFYPALGRAYDIGGEPMFTGVTMQKNTLGLLCLITGIYFAWNILLGRKKEGAGDKYLHYSIYLIMLPLITWLFYMSRSATSQFCMFLTVCLFVIARQPIFVRYPQRILIVGICCILLYGIMEMVFDVRGTIIALLGRRPDFTNRVYVWDMYLSMVKNPIVGYGFESFYTSVIMENRIEQFLPAHNGYLEMYLNLGMIGIFFVVAWMVSGFIKILNHIRTDYAAAIMRLSLIVVVAFYNWTETAFAGTSNAWLLLFFAIMNSPNKRAVEHTQNVWASINLRKKN